jgi:hypothetical protein
MTGKKEQSWVESQWCVGQDQKIWCSVVGASEREQRYQNRKKYLKN